MYLCDCECECCKVDDDARQDGARAFVNINGVMYNTMCYKAGGLCKHTDDIRHNKNE